MGSGQRRGAWADQVASLAGIAPLGLTPNRRSMARIPAPGGHDLGHWPMIFGPGETWYAKPDAGALIVSPAEEHPMPPHDAFADDMVLAEGLARYEAHVTEPVTRLLTSWAGLRTFAPDRCLVIGPEPACPISSGPQVRAAMGFKPPLLPRNCWPISSAAARPRSTLVPSRNFGRIAFGNSCGLDLRAGARPL